MTLGSSDSNRSFGILLVACFGLLGAYNRWHGHGAYPYLFGLCLLAGAATLLKPSLLAPLKRVWLRFGLIMHRVTSPLFLGVMFFGVITPVAVAMRLLGDRDVMRRRFEPKASSYWIERNPPAPDREGFKDQF